MTKLSYNTNQSKLVGYINRFWNAVTLLKEKNEVTAFLNDLLTPTEIRMISKRLQIADMLARGYDYQTIKSSVHVTSQTVASVNNKLNYGNNGLIRILLRLEKIDKQKQAKIEGRRNIFSAPGLSRAALNLTAELLSSTEKNHRKQSSVKP